MTPPGPPGTPPPEGGPQGGPQGGQRRGEPRCSGRSLRSTHGSLRAPSASGIWPAAATPGYNMPPSRDHVVRDRTPLLRSSVPCGPPVAPHRLPPLSLRSELPQRGSPLGVFAIRYGGPATLRAGRHRGVAIALLVASRWVSLGAFARRFAYRHHFPHRHRPQSPQGGSLGPLALSGVSLPWRNSPRCQGPSRRGPGPRHQRLTSARTPGRVNAPLRQSARAALLVRSAPGAELAPGANVGFKGTPDLCPGGRRFGKSSAPGPGPPHKGSAGPEKRPKNGHFSTPAAQSPGGVGGLRPLT